MTRFIYCLYDNVANRYLPVFEASNDTDAERLIMRGFDQEKLEIGDYELQCLLKITEIDEFPDKMKLSISVVEEGSRYVPFSKIKSKEK